MDLDAFQQLGQAAMAPQGQPSAVPVRFYTEAMQDPAKTTKTGRPVFVDVDMIEKHVGKDIIRRPASVDDIAEYRHLYDAFKAGQSQEAVEGTPLREWPPIKRSQAESLGLVGIRTVEQFAGCPDSTLQGVGPLMALRQLARDWLAEAKKGAGLAALRSENEALKARIAALEKMVTTQSTDIEAARQNGGALPAGPDPRLAALEQQIAALAAAVKPAEPKRRGRPPKAKPETTNGA